MHHVMTTGSDVLDRIMQHKAEEVSYAKSKLGMQELKAQAADSQDSRGFVNAIQQTIAAQRSAVIAEIKRASPSQGVIRQDFHPAVIAESYQHHGACCLSVLTDKEFFQGSINYFKQAREACTIPMLRKDFMLDAYQVFEAKVIGADCILLIAAALEDGLMQDLAGQAIELGMDVLVEVHDAQELQRSSQLKLPIIGINNRNLRTFETSLNTTLDLLDAIDDQVTVVTESGIHTAADVAQMRNHEVNCFLVGEAFMRAAEPGQKLAELFS